MTRIRFWMVCCGLGGALAVAALLPGSAAIASADASPPSELDVPSNLDIYFIDTGDGGDDPWAAGCHWHYGTDECSAPKFFFAGDSCSADKRYLTEWTESRCHEPMNDRKRYDCRALCQKKGAQDGACVVVKNRCKARHPRGPVTKDSAACVCKKQ